MLLNESFEERFCLGGELDQIENSLLPQQPLDGVNRRRVISRRQLMQYRPHIHIGIAYFCVKGVRILRVQDI